MRQLILISLFSVALLQSSRSNAGTGIGSAHEVTGGPHDSSSLKAPEQDPFSGGCQSVDKEADDLIKKLHQDWAASFQSTRMNKEKFSAACRLYNKRSAQKMGTYTNLRALDKSTRENTAAFVKDGIVNDARLSVLLAKHVQEADQAKTALSKLQPSKNKLFVDKSYLDSFREGGLNEVTKLNAARKELGSKYNAVYSDSLNHGHCALSLKLAKVAVNASLNELLSQDFCELKKPDGSTEEDSKPNENEVETKPGI